MARPRRRCSERPGKRPFEVQQGGPKPTQCVVDLRSPNGASESAAQVSPMDGRQAPGEQLWALESFSARERRALDGATLAPSISLVMTLSSSPASGFSDAATPCLFTKM